MRVAPLTAFLLIGVVLSAQISCLFGQNMSGLVVDVTEMADGSISQARLEAARQAASGGLPFRSYRQGQYQRFSGQYTPPELPEEKKGQFLYGLAIFSDDGCSVTVTGSPVLAHLAQRQHLPNLGESFHVLPVALVPGKPVEITVDYFNTIYVKPKSTLPDIDGLTLFLYLIPVAIAVDADRDGNIVLSGESKDTTSKEKPFRFWINDDHDRTPDDERDVVPATENDYADATIQTMRDLEDFARLYLHFGGEHDWVADGKFKIGLKFSDASGGGAAINVYKCTDPDGSTSYLTDEEAALAQVSGDDAQALGQVTSGDPLILPADFWGGPGERNPTKCLLFEGSGEGKGQLVLTVHNADGTQIGESGSVWIDLVNVRNMYERAKATPDNISNPHESTTTPASPSVSYILDPNGNQWHYPPLSWTEAKDYIVFVHGWNTTYDSARGFYADTMFKRLWQRGYKGRFAALYWPTLVGGTTYNESEYRAWFFGESLKQYVDGLPAEYTKHLIAHSMGNIVGGSALRKGMKVANYALIDAAVPASCYDSNTALQQSYGNSPDNDSDQPTQALAYKNKLSSVETTLINFYLRSDDALELWVLNNSLYKPEVFYTTTGGDHAYKYHPGNASGQKLFLTFLFSASRNLEQLEESLAYAARSSTRTVGAEGRTAGSITSSVDLSGFGYENEHSGFWAFTLQKVKPAYDALMDKLRVQRN
jgi:hypothetical protein